MSLDFKLTKIKDWETVTRDGDRMSAVTEGLIWSALSVGLRGITEDNVDEWLIRLALLDHLNGNTILTVDGNPRPFTRQEVEAHIGLTTNVTDRKRPSWAKEAVEKFFADEAYRIKRDKKKAAQPPQGEAA